MIQSLDIAHTEMTSFAADAAADAERARRNARTAQEIARRYQNRSHRTSSFSMDAFEAPTSAVRTKGAVGSSSLEITTSRPKRPEIMRFHTDATPSRKPTLNDGNREKKNDDDVSTPVVSKQTEMQDKASANNSSSVPNRRGFHSPGSFERISQHHADDLLQLTQELERTKQALKAEQRLHKDCQLSLASLQSKRIELMNTNQQLAEQLEMERNQSTMQITHLEQELVLSRSRLEAAEEDAQLALDLATDSSAEREKMEEALEQAQDQIEMLREQQQYGKQLSVHFADDIADNTHTNTSSTTSTSANMNIGSAQMKQRGNGPPRSMIAAGRQLLLKRNMSPQDAVIRIQLSPARSVERRQQLCRRLNEHLNEDANIALLSSSPSRTPLSPTPGNNHTTTTSATSTSGVDAPSHFSIHNAITRKELEEYHTATKILEISGKRLDLDGYWWREQSKTSSSTTIQHNPIQIDVMTRQYCQNVEVRTIRLVIDSTNIERKNNHFIHTITTLA